jgi:hypothetical protein
LLRLRPIYTSQKSLKNLESHSLYAEKVSNLGEVALVEDIVAGMDISNDLSLDLNDNDQ